MGTTLDNIQCDAFNLLAMDILYTELVHPLVHITSFTFDHGLTFPSIPVTEFLKL